MSDFMNLFVQPRFRVTFETVKSLRNMNLLATLQGMLNAKLR